MVRLGNKQAIVVKVQISLRLRQKRRFFLLEVVYLVNANVILSFLIYVYYIALVFTF